jgi:carboxylesterase type B
MHGEEDCLYLDIYLPLNINNGTLLPVVIYIYGGGLQTSTTRNPSLLISLYQNIIYVAIRYRVNIFGFMASTALSASRSGPIQSSGLQGFEDQQMAIKWVRDNIQGKCESKNTRSYAFCFSLQHLAVIRIPLHYKDSQLVLLPYVFI